MRWIRHVQEKLLALIVLVVINQGVCVQLNTYLVHSIDRTGPELHRACCYTVRTDSLHHTCTLILYCRLCLGY